MINRLDIKNFGSFKDFKWKTALGSNQFKKLNVIYGRNYSGKTTLSRIFRSLELRKLPASINSPEFVVSCQSGLLQSSDLTRCTDVVRVYNRDFVADNLGFLRDETTGTISPFAIVGIENKKLESEIAALKKALGDIETHTGLAWSYFTGQQNAAEKRKAANSANEAIEKKLVDKANKRPEVIKHNSIYHDAYYDIRKIKADIADVLATPPTHLTDEERAERVTLIKQAPLPELTTSLFFTPNISTLQKRAKEIAERMVQPTHAITELLASPDLHNWAGEGVPLHSGAGCACSFCGNFISEDRWQLLLAHFNEESARITDDIDSLAEAINSEATLAKGCSAFEFGELYADIEKDANGYRDNLSQLIKKYQKDLAAIKKALEKRRKTVFDSFAYDPPADGSTEISACIEKINLLRSANNERTKSLAADQQNAIKQLRLDKVSKFLHDIGYTASITAAQTLEQDATTLDNSLIKTEEEMTKVTAKISKLTKQLKDEKKGAERVNHYLNSFFGHDGISLEAEEDTATANYKFKIMRGADLASNLSEGECSLVAFCYFMAKLEDADTKGRDLIIYIDDPISSLDTNHIFFIFSLIESVIAKKPALGGKHFYKQLFISTHNLDFLKYLKKLSRPNEGGNEHFMICRTKSGSALELMPSYLREYVTEFNYLFDQIYKCATLDPNTSDHHCFFNFGNNLRKFLEAFLFFKYPYKMDKSGQNKRIEKFFGDAHGTDALAQRIINEYSHLEWSFDRSVQPVDQPEITKLATFMLQRLKENDADQFAALLESVEGTDPFAKVAVPAAATS